MNQKALKAAIAMNDKLFEQQEIIERQRAEIVKLYEDVLEASGIIIRFLDVYNKCGDVSEIAEMARKFMRTEQS